MQSQDVSYRHDTDREQPFHQEANFYYLSGCNVPTSALILLVRPRHLVAAAPATVRRTESILLIPDEEPSDTMWSPPPPTISQARAAYPGHGSIQLTSALTDILTSLMKAYPDAMLHTLPSVPQPLKTSCLAKSGLTWQLCIWSSRLPTPLLLLFQVFGRQTDLRIFGFCTSPRTTHQNSSRDRVHSQSKCDQLTGS